MAVLRLAAHGLLPLDGPIGHGVPDLASGGGTVNRIGIDRRPVLHAVVEATYFSRSIGLDILASTVVATT